MIIMVLELPAEYAERLQRTALDHNNLYKFRETRDGKHATVDGISDLGMDGYIRIGPEEMRDW